MTETTAKFISTIGFPYVDLDDAISVAKTILGGGGVPMDRDQLAAAMGQVPTSGNFNMKVSAAKWFGLIDNPQSKFQLTPLGFEILDGARERAAKAEAFLNVPLYRRVYETFKGRQLPPRPVGLESAFVDFGVSPKQKDKARHAFDRSARLAGFFSSPAEDRLVQPVVGQSLSVLATEAPDSAEVRIETGPAPPLQKSTAGPAAPSFLAWLLEELPPPKADWDLASQADWLRAVAQGFRVIYKSDANESILISVKKAD